MRSMKMGSVKLLAAAALAVAGLSVSPAAHAATGEITNFKVTSRQEGSGTPGQPGSYYITIYRIDYTFSAQWTTAGGYATMSVLRAGNPDIYIGGEDQPGVNYGGTYKVGPKSGYVETSTGGTFKGVLAYQNGVAYAVLANK